MAVIEIKAPQVGESVTEVVIGEWLKQIGEAVEEDELVFVVESDKTNMEVPSPGDGVLVEQLKQAGESAQVGEVIARLDTEAKASVAAAAAPAAAPAPAPAAAPAAAKLSA